MLDIEKILKELTLEEKAGLCSGADQWYTKAVERLGIPALRLSDGPHGLRYIEDGKARPAVCFPTGSALASSFDTALSEKIGTVLGKEAKKAGVHTLLGPAVNMKRSPLCGRNFEYLSEDPFLAGEMGAALVNGIQSQGVGACPKHLAANNQEYRRMSVSAQVDEQPLREIYLSAFERIVKKASPHTMMCSYNRINGMYSSENAWLLDDVLRKEWGYEGIVMTDWAAMAERPKALKAGLELEMPSSFGENDKRIVAAVRTGTLDEAVLDEAVRRILRWINLETDIATKDHIQKGENSLSAEQLAQEAAAQCAVLLKNNGVLPLKKGTKVAFIGGFAATPRFQGGGSSNVAASSSISALQAAQSISNITYAEGFNTTDDVIDDALQEQAITAAQNADVAVIFAGLPNAFESEGSDRKSLNIPESQNRLIQSICAVQRNTVVVFHAGSPVVMPWRDDVSAILYMYLGGQRVGAATVDLLFGNETPSGKLAETFPLRLEDTPCWLDFPGSEDEVCYSEGVYIGYRWYQKRDIPVQYPFGHGCLDAYIEDMVNRGAGTQPAPVPPECYADNWIGEQGCRMISELPDDRPWFLQLNFSGPHDPWDITQEMYSAIQERSFPPAAECPQEELVHNRAVRKNYAAMIENIDRQIGLCINELTRRQMLDNTIIIYAADHGELMGDHGLYGKSRPEQGSIHIPLVIDASHLGGVRDKYLHTPVELQDLAATFLDYAGVDIPENWESRSLRPLAEGTAQMVRETALSELITRGKGPLKSFGCVTDGTWKLIMRPNQPDRLYFLEDDPFECRDVINEHPQQAERLREAFDKRGVKKHPALQKYTQSFHKGI